MGESACVGRRAFHSTTLKVGHEEEVHEEVIVEVVGRITFLFHFVGVGELEGSKRYDLIALDGRCDVEFESWSVRNAAADARH